MANSGSQQHDLCVEAGYQDHDQKIGSSIQLAEAKAHDQLQRLHLGEEPKAEPVFVADLPKVWLSALVQQLPHKDRLALFRTCRGNAAAMAQHTPKITLTPHQDLQQDSHRRAFVLKLAALCSNVYLHAKSFAIELDEPAIWPHVKQLTLRNVKFSTETISRLHMEKLTQLQALKLAAQDVSAGSDIVDGPAVQRLVEAGGLLALQTLDCSRMDPAIALELLLQLGPAMGHAVTQLLLGNLKVIEAIDKWPALQQVQIPEHLGHIAISEKACKQLFNHPQLKAAHVPSHIFATSDRPIDSTSMLDLLALDDPGSVYLSLLLNIPMHAVRHLQFRCGVRADRDCQLTAVQHLHQCPHVEVLPGSWDDHGARYESYSIPRDTLVWEASFDPVLLVWFLPLLTKAEGALILNGGSGGSSSGVLGVVHLASFCLIPPGIHTLVLVDCSTHATLTWAMLIGQLRSHIHSVIIRQSEMTQADFESVLDQPPPAGLQKLTIAQDRYHMPWVAEQAETLRATARAKWPAVQVDLDLSPCYEDEQDDAMNEELEYYDEDNDEDYHEMMEAYQQEELNYGEYDW